MLSNAAAAAAAGSPRGAAGAPRGAGGALGSGGGSREAAAGSGPPDMSSPSRASQRRGVAGSRMRGAPQEEQASSGGPQGNLGSRVLQQAMREAKLRERVRAGMDAGHMAGDGEGAAQVSELAQGDPEDLTRKQLQWMFKEIPGQSSVTFCYVLHCKTAVKPKVHPPLDAEAFEALYNEERHKFRTDRRFEILRRRRKRRNHFQLNAGYSEPEVQFQAEEPEFQERWRVQSIAEDVWKAEYYQQLYRKAHTDIPEVEPLATRRDRLADVFAASYRKHLLDQNRPVLTHELADFENPYMMKRSALERVLSERCVRNQLDERVMPRVLDKHPDLVKLRAEAALPPEVLEPLAAFRGDTRWSFDARERLAQKLEGVSSALEAVEAWPSAADVAEALPENAPVDPNQVGGGIYHPWRNHIGFESLVPSGVAGGTKFGQPPTVLEDQVRRMRYPTLQRVAHTLPADPKWRAHVVRTIRVLERSKDWDFQSKLNAVNKMKDIYDQLKPSAEYTAKLDEKLPLNRVPSHLKRKFAKDKQYVKTFPKRFLLKKSFTRYRASLTADAPMKVSQAKHNFK